MPAALLKTAYISVVRLIDRAVAVLGGHGFLAKRRGKRFYHWVSSLFAIHDLDRMIGLDVPWWTYRSIDRVSEFLLARPEARVFEYGSGASSLWLATRSKCLISVEHDPAWHQILTPYLAAFDHVEYRLIEADEVVRYDPFYQSGKHGFKGQSFASYATAIESVDGVFDLIVIDGRARQACLHHALSRLAADGMIVFDNSWRGRYKSAISASGLSATVLTGLTPALPLPDQTTILVAKGTDQTMQEADLGG